MEDLTFRGTDLKYSELTKWILSLMGSERIAEIRYFGSRVFGEPRPDSDIDVYLLLEELEDDEDDDFSLGPLFSKKFKGHVIEFHPMIDFHDGYVPDWLLKYKTRNELELVK